MGEKSCVRLIDGECSRGYTYYECRGCPENSTEERPLPKLSRPQCTEPCEFQNDWACWHDGSITIEDRKCISFAPRSEVEKK